MKPLLIAFLLIINIPLNAQQQLEKLFSLTDEFLNEYVIDGNIKYGSIKENPQKLIMIKNIIKKFEPSEIKNENTLLAFWINAYNIIVIDGIIKHYPIDSPLDVEGFFNSIKHKVGSQFLTLNEIEHDKLFANKRDPRFHFALVCGAVGCPEIVNYAYQPSQLEIQLENRAKTVLSNQYFVGIDQASESVVLSEIFKWYKDDFTQNGLTLIQYINKYRYESVPESLTVKYKNYDWTLNNFFIYTKESKSLQSYTPSVLLSKGEYEIKIFNNLYTQTKFFDGEGNRINQGSRSSFFTSLMSFLYGYTTDLNFGVELWLRSVRNDIINSSPFETLGFDNNRTAISRFGPKIKFTPFKNEFLTDLSIQTTLLIPVVSDLDGLDNDGSAYLDDDAYIWLNQFFYDRPINNYLSYFAEIDTWIRIDRDFNGARNSLQLPLKLFLSYYPTDNLTIYGMNEFLYQWSATGQNKTITSYFNQSGLGIKYHLFHHIELEGLVTVFLLGKNSGAGQTFNLGFRIVN